MTKAQELLKDVEELYPIPDNSSLQVLYGILEERLDLIRMTIPLLDA